MNSFSPKPSSQRTIVQGFGASGEEAFPPLCITSGHSYKTKVRTVIYKDCMITITEGSHSRLIVSDPHMTVIPPLIIQLSSGRIALAQLTNVMELLTSELCRFVIVCVVFLSFLFHVYKCLVFLVFFYV